MQLCSVLWLLPPANEVLGKVMFSQVFVHGGGGLVGFPGCITGHMTGESTSNADPPPPIHGILRDTVTKRAVRILLECIIVLFLISKIILLRTVFLNIWHPF